MRERASITTCLVRLGQSAQLWLYPSLASLPPSRRGPALRAARSVELDLVERLGIVASVGMSAYLLESVGRPPSASLLTALGQLFLALSLIGILAAPWLVRRTRRGLRRQAAPP